MPHCGPNKDDTFSDADTIASKPSRIVILPASTTSLQSIASFACDGITLKSVLRDVSSAAISAGTVWLAASASRAPFGLVVDA